MNGKKITKDSEINDPKPVKDSVENFPPAISASLTINTKVYYFLKLTKYCKRPLIIGMIEIKQNILNNFRLNSQITE